MTTSSPAAVDGVLEVADERPDQRAIGRLDDDQRHARQLALEPRPQVAPRDRRRR